MIYIVGDSHTSGYGQAARDAEFSHRVSGGPIANARELALPFADYVDGVATFKVPRMASRFETVVGTPIQEADDTLKGRLVLSVGLDAGPFLKDLSKEWHGLGSVPARKGGQYLSSALIAEMIGAAVAPALEFYDHCHARGWLIGAIAGPPMQERFSGYAVFGDEGMRLWSQFQAPVSQWLAERDIPLIRPVGVTDENNLLKPEYWGQDAVHGNAAYGAAVLRAVLQSV